MQMTVTAASYWNFRKTVDEQNEDNLDHCAGS